VANGAWSEGEPPAPGESVQIGSSSSHPTVIIDNGITAYAGTTIANFGEISIDAHNQGLNYTTVLDISGATALEDGGSVVMGASEQTLGDCIFSSVAGSELDNIDNTISGTGEIGVIGGDGSVLMNLANESAGVIDGTGSTTFLLIDGLNATNYMTLTNNGLLEATGSYASSITNGALEINYATVNQSGGGTISGAGGIVTLAQATVIGGTISSSGSGFVNADYATFDGTSSAVTITAGSTVEITNGGALTLAGTSSATGSIVNHGTIDMAPGGYTSEIVIGSGASGTVTLSGGGTITLTGQIIGGAANAVLINVNNTIAGRGSIGFSGSSSVPMDVTNEVGGVIDANNASTSLLIEGNSGNTEAMTVTNDGLMEATGAAADGLQIDYTIINQSGGGTLLGANGNVTLNASTVIGGTLKSTGSGLIEVLASATLDGTTSAVTITSGSTVEMTSGGKLTLAAASGATGSIVNHGAIVMGPGGYTSELAIGSGSNGGTVALSGGGNVTLDGDVVGGAAGGVLDDIDNKIIGIGSIGVSGFGTPAMSLEIGAAGVVEASGSSSSTLTIDTGSTVANNGTLEANGAKLVVDDAVSGIGSATITNGGVIDFAGNFQENATFQGADAGTLSLSQTYGGTISGVALGDIIALADTTFASGDHLALQSVQNGVETFAVENSSNAVLTTLHIAGDYEASDFSAANSGGHLQFTLTSTTQSTAVHDDFTGDGQSSVLWRNTNGDTVLWNPNGSGGYATQDLGIVPTSYQIAGTGDFTGDGQSSILWRNSNGDAVLWDSNGSGGFSTQDLGVVATSYQVAGVADFNGDGKADILWRNTGNGDTVLWNSNGSGGFSTQDLGVVSTGYQIAGVGDFNGDGQADILWRNTSNGDTLLWDSNGSGGFTTHDLGVVSTGYQIAGVGDFNGDAKADILWRNTGNGDALLWNSNGSGGFSTQDLGVVATSYQIADIGNFSGGSEAGILWRNTNGDAVLWNPNGSGGFTGRDLGVVGTSYQVQSV
jgi:hypothetical protein